MKIILLTVIIALWTASKDAVQTEVALLPVEAQMKTEPDFIDNTLGFIKGLFNSYFWDRQRSLFKQWDRQWGDQVISDMTVWQVGSLMSSAAMALNSRGKTVDGKAVNPKTLNIWLKNNGGYIGDHFVWSSISSIGLKYTGESKDHSDIRNCLCTPSWEVILNVKMGGHYVIATGYDPSGYSVNDPGFVQQSYTYEEVVTAHLFTA